jgi:hypothetical protein
MSFSMAALFDGSSDAPQDESVIVKASAVIGIRTNLISNSNGEVTGSPVHVVDAVNHGTAKPALDDDGDGDEA